MHPWWHLRENLSQKAPLETLISIWYFTFNCAICSVFTCSEPLAVSAVSSSAESKINVVVFKLIYFTDALHWTGFQIYIKNYFSAAQAEEESWKEIVWCKQPSCKRKFPRKTQIPSKTANSYKKRCKFPLKTWIPTKKWKFLQKKCKIPTKSVNSYKKGQTSKFPQKRCEFPQNKFAPDGVQTTEPTVEVAV